MHESVYTLVPSWWLCKLHVEAYLKKKNQESAKGIVIGALSQTIVTVYLPSADHQPPQVKQVLATPR